MHTTDYASGHPVLYPDMLAWLHNWIAGHAWLAIQPVMQLVGHLYNQHLVMHTFMAMVNPYSTSFKFIIFKLFLYIIKYTST